MRKTMLLGLLLAVCGVTEASEWVSAEKSVDGKVELFVDVSSIRVAGAIRHAWIKTVFGGKGQKGEGVDANKWASNGVMRNAFNCDEETSQVEAVTIYFTDGTNRSEPALIFPTPWTPVAPDTVLSTVMRFVCVWKPPK